MSKKKSTPMTPNDAARIQRHADKNETNGEFKSRVQSAAAKNVNQGKVPAKKS